MKVVVKPIFEHCPQSRPVKSWVDQCIRCGKEICEACACRCATCQECASQETEPQLEARCDRVFAEFMT